MAAHRTQKQKAEALARRLAKLEKQQASPTGNQQRVQQQSELQDILGTDLQMLRRDILKTVVISLVLFAGIFGIVIYLS